MARSRRRPPPPAPTPKGRQVDPHGARRSPRAARRSRARRRDLLIEHLHLIQDHYGHLSAAHLAALAAEMKLAHTEVYEVATFYAHFDVVKEGETPPPPVTVRVCDSLVLRHGGRRASAARSAGKLGTDVRVVRAPCMGACDRAPVCAVGHVQVMQRDAGQCRARREGADARARAATPTRFRAYRDGRRLRAAAAIASPASARATS